MEYAIKSNQPLNDHEIASGNGVKIVTAETSKKNAKTFYYGNIIAVLMPFPFFIFWFGASMFVYALYRHHPNRQVGRYTQNAAYYYYGLAGLLLPALTFASGDFFFRYWAVLWAACALALIPVSILMIHRINKDDWQDTEYE